MNDTLMHYLVMDCHVCNNPMYVGPCVTALTHNGLPVIMADSASLNVFECSNCEAQHYVGDLDVLVEEHDEPHTDEEVSEE